MSTNYSPIDFKEAMEITDGDAELFEALLEVFIQNKAAYIDDLENAVFKRNSKEIRENAHRSKSGLASMGAVTASLFAKKLEQMGSLSDFTNIDEIFKTFKNELTLLTDYIKSKKWLEEIKKWE
ncbi:MAG: Hpt domain-containing protein [Spirochaetota bacterium]|nr:Hpt domain-containing protein [Spirochaetota bacterium]